MTDTALILVDIQNDYFPSGAWPVAQMEEAAANAARLLTAARSHGDLVVHVRHEASAQAPFFRPGTPGAELRTTVQPTPDEAVIVKHRPNSFQGTGLLALLQNRNIKQITICGAQSQMCIDATTRAAADYGFRVTVIDDACAAKEATFNGQDVPAAMVHAAFMAPLAMSYAKVITTDTYLTT
ncbi:cysteine hydrolase family protein [Thalassovita taeanensis]|uniref:Nicotinamidase-related amidase n=1 Tax=Thalassovita taeanensis TaxID=657014 RepID=A0A1H9GBB9_9RHOB|nr:cysteine hydrolase family protein [Thalassovita taeanensis]SEQ47369.1 Nicotinamidase-related amidase [Thalassovita taeanensis]